MSEKQKKYYLYIDGQAVPVSEQVYRTYHHYGRKEEYFTYDLKTEKFSCDQEAQTATFTPSREDSYPVCDGEAAEALHRRSYPGTAEEAGAG